MLLGRSVLCRLLGLEGEWVEMGGRGEEGRGEGVKACRNDRTLFDE
jgi:hypothetical protein